LAVANQVRIPALADEAGAGVLIYFMKTFFTFLFLSLSQYSLAQNFGVRDFLLAQKAQDFELSINFLVRYHNFHYSKDLLEGACKGYQLQNGSQQLNIMRCLSPPNSENAYGFVLLYRIPVKDFSEFKKSLIDADYSIYSVTNATNGHKVTMWTLKSEIKTSVFFTRVTIA